MQIIPIQITSTDWQTYKARSVDVMRRLDRVDMSPDVPSSFIATLSNLYPADITLRNAVQYRLTDHAFASFLLLDLDDTTKASLSECGQVALACPTKETAVLSGTITQMHNLVVCLSTFLRPIQQRLLGNGIYISLDRGGYRPIFYDYTRNNLDDGTFELCKRK